MIEVVRLLMEGIRQILSGLSGISAAKRQQKINEIGGQLFMLYVRLNEVIISAEHLIECLETYVERMTSYLTDGKDKYALTAGHWILHDIKKQRLNLGRVGYLMDKLSWELMVVDGGSAVDLAPLLDRKAGALSAILNTLDQEDLPIPRESDVEKLFAAMTDRQAHWRSNRHAFSLLGRLVDDVIPTGVPWDERTYEVVKNYLEVRRPREELERIRASVAELRASLLAHFSAEDMLLAVADRRLDGGW